MKFDFIEDSPAGNKRIIFLVGYEEVLLIGGMLKCALANTPKTEESLSMRNRLRSMSKQTQKFIRDKDELYKLRQRQIAEDRENEADI